MFYRSALLGDIALYDKICHDYNDSIICDAIAPTHTEGARMSSRTALETLSPETIDALVDIKQQLESVCEAMRHYVKTDPKRVEDDALWNIFVCASNTQVFFPLPPPENLKLNMPATVVGVYTSSVVPAYQAVSALVQETWDAVRSVIEAKETTDELLAKFLEQDEPKATKALEKAKKKLIKAYGDELQA